MAGTVVADERKICADNSDEPGKPIAAPASLVCEVLEDKRDRSLWCEDNERDQDGKKAQSMKNQDDALNLRQQACSDGVDEDASKQARPHKQSAVPSLITVVWVVENQQTLDHGATEEDTSRRVGIPPEGRDPSCEPAQEVRVALWS